MENAEFWKVLEDTLPAFFTRHDLPLYLGSLLSPAGLANLDSKGLGPKVKQRVGKRVLYERTSFIAWLRSRVKE